MWIIYEVIQLVKEKWILGTSGFAAKNIRMMALKERNEGEVKKRQGERGAPNSA